MSTLAQKGLPITNLNAKGAADAGGAGGTGDWVALPQYSGPYKKPFTVDIVQVGGPPAARTIKVQGSNDGGTSVVEIDSIVSLGNDHVDYTDFNFALVRTNLTVYGAGGGSVSTKISI